MPIRFAPPQKSILLCDYSMGGFIAPEMVKKRPALVVRQRPRHADGLCTVVPLSTSEPAHEEPQVIRLELERALPAPYDQMVCWAKCDMVATVCFARLDLFRTERAPNGKRRYFHGKVGDDDFRRVQQGILHGLGMSVFANHLTPADEAPN
jgi:mRNA interferase MazF